VLLRIPRHLPARARQEGGFGMIELLAAMAVMLIGLMAVFGLFQAGILQIRRASTITTAAALADAEMEKFRAVKYEVLGLVDTAVDGADATYQGDAAYRTDTPTTTLSGTIGTSDTTVTLTGSSGFPTFAPFLIQVDNERMLVTEVVSATSWKVTRAYDGTAAATHSGSSVKQKKRVHLPSCSSSPAPCTDAVPTKTATGADGKAYRVDTYITWQTVTNAAIPAAAGRVHKLITIVVRDSASPYRTWARASSAFDLSTGS
jgi:type II secretory pathway pseudopilin PulG